MSVTITADSLEALVDELVAAGLVVRPSGQHLAESDRLRAALGALTEVGDPPEGWTVDHDGDLIGPRGTDFAMFVGDELHLSDGISVAVLPASVVRYRLALERARQAQAALDGSPEPAEPPCVDATNTGDDLPDPRADPPARRRPLCKNCGCTWGEHLAHGNWCPDPASDEWDDTTYEPWVRKPVTHEWACSSSGTVGVDRAAQGWIVHPYAPGVGFPSTRRREPSELGDS